MGYYTQDSVSTAMLFIVQIRVLVLSAISKYCFLTQTGHAGSQSIILKPVYPVIGLSAHTIQKAYVVKMGRTSILILKEAWNEKYN